MEQMEGPINNVPLSPPSPFPEVPSAPPPPPEVKVRTMRSDLESMAKSGGGPPSFRTVKVAGLAVKNNPVARAARAKKEKALIIALVAVAAAAAVACIGYLAYWVFFSGSVAPQPQPQQSPQSGTGAGASAAQSNTAITNATSVVTSIPPAAQGASSAAASSAQGPSFKEPADQILTLVLRAGGTVTSAADLQTFNQKLSALLTTVNKNSNFIEIDAKGADGHDLGIGEILSQANAQIIDPALLAENFDPTAAFFVYQDKNGFWPGYVLSLQEGKNWLFLENNVAKLEASPNIANLFLYDIGAPSTSGFMDGRVASTSVRVLPFPSANPPASFVYGWYETRLVVSTSLAGFARAVSHL